MIDPLGHTEQQAARIVGVSDRTLRRWRKSGAVGFNLTPGGRVRYTEEHLHKLRLAMNVAAKLGHTCPDLA